MVARARQAVASTAGGSLTRSDPAATAIRRRRCGRGFRYLGPDSAVIKDPRTRARIKALVIPPAWEDVWICADPRGHIQAIGTDSAGRRQYRYHDLWREQRDQDKHDRVRGAGERTGGNRARRGRVRHPDRRPGGGRDADMGQDHDGAGDSAQAGVVGGGRGHRAIRPRRLGQPHKAAIATTLFKDKIEQLRR